MLDFLRRRGEAARPVCASADLPERGDATLIEVRNAGEVVTAFALRFDGRVVAYLNRCAHMPAEMDWQPGKFLDAEREHIICSMHGATYEPRHGHCVAGPCRGARLVPVEVRESGGQVYWYPSRDIRPVFDDPAGRATESPP